MGKFGDWLVIMGYAALATTLVMHEGTAGDINALGNQGTNFVKATTGQG